MDPSLCLFGDKQPEQAIQDVRFITYQPITQISNTATSFDFSISGEGSLYTDLSRIPVKVKGRLVNEDDGKPAAPKEFVVNNLLSSLFSQVDCYLNQKLITESNNDYSLKSTMECILTTSAAEKENQLQSQLFYPDTPGYMVSTYILQNNGLLSRNHRMKNGNVELAGKLHIDLFKSGKLLLSGVNMRFNFFRQKASYYIMSAVTSKSKATFQIEEISLIIPRVKTHTNVLLSHGEFLKSQPAVYHFERSSIRIHTIPVQNRTLTLENLFSDQVPNKVIIGLVSNKGFAGDVTKNPYNFAHFGITSCSLILNGAEVPGNEMSLDFSDTQNTNATAYCALTELIRHHYHIADAGISLKQFNQGTTLLAFDLQHCSAFQECDIKTGNLRLRIEFSTGLTVPVTVCMYATFPTKLKINGAKVVTYQN